MLEVEPTGHCGHRGGNVLEGENITSSLSRKPSR